jgi:uncharacterized phage infection (PIP) family protein YhgE
MAESGPTETVIPAGAPTPDELVELANQIRDSVTVGLNDRTNSLTTLLGTLNASIEAIAGLLSQLEAAIKGLINTQARSGDEKERIKQQLSNLTAAHNKVKEALIQLRDAYDAGIKELTDASGQLESVPGSLDTKIKQPIETLIGLSGPAPPAPMAPGAAPGFQPPSGRLRTTGGRRTRIRRTKRGGYVYGKKQSSRTRKYSRRSSRRSRRSRR